VESGNIEYLILFFGVAMGVGGVKRTKQEHNI